MSISPHYHGPGGEQYAAYQGPISDLGAELTRWQFLPHLDGTQAVVDFGCGNGRLLAGLPAAERIGVEPNRAAYPRPPFPVVATARELDDACADIVISNHALEHTLCPHSELLELARALKPTGKLVLWLPLDDWRTQRKPDPACDPNHHLYTWTPLLLHNLLTSAGFQVEGTPRVVTHAWPPKVALLSRLPAFSLTARIYSALVRRRQLEAVATRP